jgi:hypothetical protein
MEFLSLPNKGSITPLCCGDNPDCQGCYDLGCFDCACNPSFAGCDNNLCYSCV